MADFGRAKEHVFRGFLKLKHAIPSHDTFSTVFRMIDPRALDAAFGRVLAQIAVLLGDGDVIAIDGKALRGARDKGQIVRQEDGRADRDDGLGLCRPVASDAGPRHWSLWRPTMVANGRRRTGGGTRSARPDRAQGQGRDGGCAALQSLHGCSDHARRRRRLLPRTEGQSGKLLPCARSCFGKVLPDHPVAHHEAAGHGSKEASTGTVVSAKGLAEHDEFPGLQAFGRIGSRWETDGKVQTETRHFALSWMPAPEVFMAAARGFHGPRPLGNRKRAALAT